MLNALEVPKVGTGLDLQPDYCGGLLKLAKKIDETGKGIGYVDMFGNPTVILTKVSLFATFNKLNRIESSYSYEDTSLSL